MHEPASTTSDITLSRGREDYLLKQGTATERVLADKDDRIEEMAHTIKCFQNQGNPALLCSLLIMYHSCTFGTVTYAGYQAKPCGARSVALGSGA